MVWMTKSTLRRTAPRLVLAGLMAVAVLATGALKPAAAQGVTDSHVLTAFGKNKYGPDFTHFDYVNVNAPKGGRIRLGAFGTFDSLNVFSIKGNAERYISLIYESLFTSPQDEASVSYGQIAESVSYPDDFSSATFKIRENARWHDGTPITPEDIIFSLTALKDVHPFYAKYYKNVTGAEKSGEREVTFRFDTTNNRELPLIVSELTILPKHFWEAKDADGNPRNLAESTLEVPLGSGPYRVSDVKPGTSITLERVADHWGADLPVYVGTYNFDVIEVTYFRDQTVMMEAFKAGNVDIRSENQAKRWATAYDFPAVEKGQVIKDVFTSKYPQGMSAFIFNTRREQFKDPAVRLAFNYAFDFDWTNKNIFHDQYKRTESYFEASVLKSEGLPQGLELEMLDEFRGQVPDEVFTKEYKNPTSPDRKATRNNFRTALRLFKQAGWETREGKLINAETGKQMRVEFLMASPDQERVVLPYKRTLDRLGIDFVIRTVDTSQFQNRIDNFDFDMFWGGWRQSLSPGNEQRDYWTTEAADVKGGKNYAGIKDPVIDKLVDRIIFAANREEQVAATKALDRVLLWGHYVVPTWHFDGSRIAWWDRFGMPEERPQYGFSYLATWWYDAAKARALDGS